MKYFIVTDVHSCFDEMKEALDNSGFDSLNNKHIFVSLGDLFDRGEQSVECLEFVNDLPENRKILIRGNHEDLMEDILRRGYFYNIDSQNGTAKTFEQLSGMNYAFSSVEEVIQAVASNEALVRYLSSLKDYYEIGDYILVHGWIPCHASHIGSDVYNYKRMDDWRNASKSDWDECRWYNPFIAWEQEVRENGKTIVCGHWWSFFANSHFHNSGIHNLDDIYFIASREEIRNAVKSEKNKAELFRKYVDFSPFVDDGIIGLDACTNISKLVNCLVIED